MTTGLPTPIPASGRWVASRIYDIREGVCVTG